jgi:hypothetical protein
MRSPFLKGESSFARLIHPSRRVIHPSKRVNGRVNRVNHPSKGEWGFARYTLAKNFFIQSLVDLLPIIMANIQISSVLTLLFRFSTGTKSEKYIQLFILWKFISQLILMFRLTRMI